MIQPAQGTPRNIDVAAVIENRSFDRFNIRLVLISWLITVCDGFDMMVVSFTAPYIRDELGLTTGQLATVFSSGLLGMTIGGLIFSTISDRVGRRPVVIGTLARLASGLRKAKTIFTKLAMLVMMPATPSKNEPSIMSIATPYTMANVQHLLSCRIAIPRNLRQPAAHN